MQVKAGAKQAESEHSHSVHIHDPAHTKLLLDRLARIEGHVRGISNMIRENRPCPEVLIQISAARAALNRVSNLVLKEHLNDCVFHAVESNGGAEELAALNHALDHLLD